MSDYQFRQCLTDDVLCTQWRTRLQMKDGDISTSVPPQPPRRPCAYVGGCRLCRLGPHWFCVLQGCVWSSFLLITSWHGAHQLRRWTTESVSQSLMLAAVVENCLFTALRQNRVILLLAINDTGWNISIYSNYHVCGKVALPADLVWRFDVFNHLWWKVSFYLAVSKETISVYSGPQKHCYERTRDSRGSKISRLSPWPVELFIRQEYHQSHLWIHPLPLENCATAGSIRGML